MGDAALEPLRAKLAEPLSKFQASFPEHKATFAAGRDPVLVLLCLAVLAALGFVQVIKMILWPISLLLSPCRAAPRKKAAVDVEPTSPKEAAPTPGDVDVDSKKKQTKDKKPAANSGKKK